MRTLTVECLDKIDQKVTLKGWVDVKRDHGKITFINLRDRSGLVQVVLDGSKGRELKHEDVIIIEGVVVKRPESMVNPKLKTGTIEINAEAVTVIAKAQELPFDIGKDELDLELPTLLDYRSLTLRHPKIQAIFKIQAVVIDSFRRALAAKDFFEFQAPSIISSAPEGGADIFEVKYFDYQAYLAQSPQLYKSLLVSDFERVYSVNKVWRAEPSVTTRHLTEVVSLDAEMGFIESWLDVKDMAEYTIKFILAEVKAKCQAELAMYQTDVPSVSETIPYLKLREAQQVIYERTGRDVRQEKDLSPEDEREICSWAKETHQSDLVFVTHFPTKFRPFYTYPDDENPEFNQGFDLLGRGVEWLTGGRRIHDYQTLMNHVKEWKITPENIELYLQAYRYGMPPLGGFAFGAERITMQILGLKNIREASLFPRDMERVDVRLSTIQSRKVAYKDTDTPYEKIIKQLKSYGVSYKHFEHEPVFTSEEASKVRGTTDHQGAKALVLQADKEFILLVVPSDMRADLDKVKAVVKAKRLAMASKDSVKAKTGLEVGAIPPFGSVIGLPTYVDSKLSDNQEIAFNAGRHDRSIKMKFTDFVKIEKPVVITR